MNKSTILNCLNCGSMAHVYCNGVVKQYYVTCKNCGQQGRMSSSEDRATEMWNDRNDTPTTGANFSVEENSFGCIWHEKESV